MATALDEQVLDLVVSKLATITIANGYEETVLGVHRPPVDLFDLAAADCPALIVRKKTKLTESNLRLAEDLDLEVEVLCAVDGSAADVHEALTDLVADVKKLVHANRLWNNGSSNLAVATRLVEDRIHETEVQEDVASAVVRFLVQARADLANPYVTKTI